MKALEIRGKSRKEPEMILRVDLEAEIPSPEVSSKKGKLGAREQPTHCNTITNNQEVMATARTATLSIK